jgi:hypothetical protein
MNDLNITIRRGSTSVYADLGYSDAESMKIKAALVRCLAGVLKTRRYSQKTGGADHRFAAVHAVRDPARAVPRRIRGEAETLSHLTRASVKIVVTPPRRGGAKSLPPAPASRNTNERP